MKRVRIVVAYDGTNYCGWQIQPNGITIEEVLNRVLCDLTGEEIRVIGASRTDSGVHALGNVAVFDTQSKIPPERILVVCDDISLPTGKLRLRRSGSAGGHNGLKSIIAQLHSDQFPRLKMGVGQKPHPDYDLADWVLGKFSPADAKIMNEAAERACDAIECLLSQGMDKAMSKFN